MSVNRASKLRVGVLCERRGELLISAEQLEVQGVRDVLGYRD